MTAGGGMTAPYVLLYHIQDAVVDVFTDEASGGHSHTGRGGGGRRRRQYTTFDRRNNGLRRQTTLVATPGETHVALSPHVALQLFLMI